jgi:hypothetical protein
VVGAKRVTLRASCVSPTTYITKRPPLAIVLISMSHVKGRAKQMYFSKLPKCVEDLLLLCVWVHKGEGGLSPAPRH